MDLSVLGFDPEIGVDLDDTRQMSPTCDTRQVSPTSSNAAASLSGMPTVIPSARALAEQAATRRLP